MNAKAMIFAVFFLVIIIWCGCSQKSVQENNLGNDIKDTTTDNVKQKVDKEKSRTETPDKCDYQIIGSKNISIKALDKPLSSYDLGEIDKLPLNIRMLYWILVPIEILEDELKTTLKQVVHDKSEENPDIDEIAVMATHREADVGSSYSAGKVEWCPNGDWGGVTSRIASTNDRSSYELKFDIKKNVSEKNKAEVPTEREFEIYEAYSELLYEPNEEIDKLYSSITSENMNEVLGKIEKIENARDKRNKKEICKRFNISVEELDKISFKVMAFKYM